MGGDFFYGVMGVMGFVGWMGMMGIIGMMGNAQSREGFRPLLLRLLVLLSCGAR